MTGPYSTPGFFVSEPAQQEQHRSDVPNSATSTPGGPSAPSGAPTQPAAPDPSTQGAPTAAAPVATNIGVAGGTDKSSFTPQTITAPPGAQPQTTISATPAVQAQQAGGARQMWQGDANKWDQTNTQNDNDQGRHWPEWDEAYNRFQQGQPQQQQSMPTFMSPIAQAQPPSPPPAAPPTYVPPKNNNASSTNLSYNV